jgi:hypothetical protein
MRRQQRILAPARPGAEVVCRALLRGLDRDPAETLRCPACNEVLADPTADQLLTVADLAAEELSAAYGALAGGMGLPPPPQHTRAKLLWCPACTRLVTAGSFPAAWQRLIHEGRTRPEDAPAGLLRNRRDRALVHVVMLSTGHTDTEERWLRANGYRSWLNYYDGDYHQGGSQGFVTDYWQFLVDDALAGPVLELAIRYGWWPEVEVPAAPGPASANPYGDILIEGNGLPSGPD